MSENKYFIADLPELFEKKIACREHYVVNRSSEIINEDIFS